jgi:PKD repeat protein
MMRVTGSGHGTQPLEFAWDFGDGTLAVGSRAAHTYVAPGDYRLTLTVRDASGASASDATIVAVAPRIAPARLSSIVMSYAVAGRPVLFSAQALDEDPAALSYVWAFSDGQSAIGPQATATFPVAGTYLASVAVVNDVGAIATIQISFSVAEAPQ